MAPLPRPRSGEGLRVALIMIVVAVALLSMTLVEARGCRGRSCRRRNRESSGPSTTGIIMAAGKSQCGHTLLWFRTAKNQDVSTGLLACPFARSLAPLTHLLALHCLLRSRTPLRPFGNFT